MTLEPLSEEFLLRDEPSEETWSSMRRVHFGSMEFEFSIFSLPLFLFNIESKIKQSRLFMSLSHGFDWI